MIKKLILTLIAFFTFSLGINVNAECTTKDLEALDIYAANVKASYDLIDNSVKKTATEDGQSKDYIIPNFAFNISLYNITKDIYVKVSNDVDTNIITVKNSDTTNNIYSFVNNDFYNIYNYNIDIYSNSSNCSERKLKTINLTKKRYNVFSETDFCQNNSDSLCDKFVSTKNISYNDFLDRLSPETSTNIDSEQTSAVQSFLKNNGKRLAIVIVLITFIIVLMIIVKRNIDDNKMKKGGWKI